MNPMPNSFSQLKPKVVLGVAAHPDDLDFGAAGSFAVWAEAGAETYYLILTDGGKGSADRSMTSEQLIEIRREEQRAAAKALGVKEVFFLNYEDGALMCDLDVKRDIVKFIRRLKPDVVVAFDPTVTYVAERGIINHPDHRAAGQAVLDACFPLARDHLSFPELLEEGHEPHAASTVLLVNFKKHNFAVDISNTMDKKLDAIRAHASQVADFDKAKNWMRELATELGKQNQMDLAEAFVRIDIN